MTAVSDPRYEPETPLSQTAGRQVDFAHDRLTGSKVVLKRVPLAEGCWEARCLLRLPPGIGPRLLDLFRVGSRDVVLVLEHIPGRPLAESRDLDAQHVAELALRFCQVLGHVHRAGWIHGDLRPANVLFDEAGNLRLLDFGFAHDRYGSAEGAVGGGLPPYLAPEISREWVVDGRADLYSLGVLLEEDFPGVREDSRWPPIVARLRDELPARRFADSVELADAIAAAFGIRLDPQPPALGGGPLRGREEPLSQLKSQLRRHSLARVLIQSRPGCGLTRFLLEAALDAAAEKRSCLRVVDLGGTSSVDMEILEQLLRLPCPVVLGVDDPSPGLTWKSGPEADRLRSIVLQAAAHPAISLRAIEPQDFSEIVSATLGAPGPDAVGLSSALYERTEGDLGLAAEGFAHCMRSSGVPEGQVWHLDPTGLGQALEAWHPAPPPPVFEGLPDHLQRSLESMAQLGRAFDRDLATLFSGRFLADRVLAELENRGLLLPPGEGRLAFVTQRLWRDAASKSRAATPGMSVWLLEHYRTRPDDVDGVIFKCSLARRVGDHETERRAVSTALLIAHQQRRWRDALRLITASTGSPETWTITAAEERLEAFRTVVGDAWSRERLAVLLGMALRAVSPEVSLLLLQSAAEGEDQEASFESRCILADLALRKGKDGEHAIGLLSKSQHPYAGGAVDFLQARHAYASSREAEAQALCGRAVRRLRGSRHWFEPLSLQLLAALKSVESPKAAIRALRSAVHSSHDPETAAQLRTNLALIYSQIGQPTLEEQCAEEGIREAVRDHATRGRIVGLRIRRAWSWADLGRIEAAKAEALDLLPVVRFDPVNDVTVRGLLAFCHLHCGMQREALRAAAEAWLLSTEVPGSLQDHIWCQYIDTLLDFEAWDVVQAHGQELERTLSAAGPNTRARLAALLKEAEGDPEAALAALRLAPAMTGARDVLTVARYLHQLGRLSLAIAVKRKNTEAALRAAAVFEDELLTFPRQGYGYYRGRARLDLAKASRAAGELAVASQQIDQAIALARRFRCLGLLTDCLEFRGQVDGP